MPSKKGEVGDFPTYSHQVTGSLEVGKTGASLSDLFGYSKEFEHQLQLYVEDFTITSFLYESENDNAFIEFMEQEICKQEVDDDLLPPPMVIKITDRIQWSPELQRRFLRAIEVLGGPEKATPSSIFYLMNVKEGLTVDHVKSHLQSYRQTLDQESTKRSKLANTASVTLDPKRPRKATRSASVALDLEGPSKPRTANKRSKGKETAYNGTLEEQMLYEEEIQKLEEAQNRDLEVWMQFPGQTMGNFEQLTDIGAIPTLSDDFLNAYTLYASYSAAANYY